MPENEQPKRPAPRKETMQQGEVDARQHYYLPDYNRSVLAHDAAEAAEIARKEADKEVNEDQSNG